MLVVIYGGIDPLTQLALRKAFLIELIAKMPINIIDHHDKQEQRKGEWVDWINDHACFL